MWMYHAGIDEYWEIPADYPQDAIDLWGTHGWVLSDPPPEP